MSVREHAVKMEKNQKEIGVLYSSLQGKAKSVREQYEKLGEFIRVLDSIGNVIPDATKYTDPLEIPAERFLQQSAFVEETKQRLLQIDGIYETVFKNGKDTSTKQSTAKVAEQPAAKTPKRSTVYLGKEKRFLELVSSGINTPDDLMKNLGVSQSYLSTIGTKLADEGKVNKTRLEGKKLRIVYSIPGKIGASAATSVPTEEPMKMFDYESWLKRIEGDVDLSNLTVMGSGGIRVLLERQNTSDIVKISEAANMPTEKVDKTLRAFEHGNILSGQELSDYGKKLIGVYKSLGVPERIALHLSNNAKTVETISSLMGSKPEEVMKTLDQMKGCVVPLGNGYAFSPKFFKFVDDARAKIRESNVKRNSTVTVEVKATAESPQNLLILSLEKNFGTPSINRLDFRKKAVWQMYENLAKKCSPKELVDLNSAVSRTMKEEMSVKDYYKTIEPLRKKLLPRFSGNSDIHYSSRINRNIYSHRQRRNSHR